VEAQVGPGLQSGGEAFRDGRYVKQHRFTMFQHAQPAELSRIHARGTEQLGRGAEVVEVVRVLPKAKGNPDFFVGNRRVVRWERGIEVALVVRRARSTAVFRSHSGKRSPAPLERANRMARPDTWACVPQLAG